MALTELQVQSSLITWISNNYVGDVDWGGLDQFDPDGDDLESWIHFHVDKLVTQPYRKNNKKIIDVRIVVQCWSREGEDDFGDNDRYRAVRKASEIATLLTHKEIPIYDYETEAETQTGNCRLFEAKITDETDRSTDENSGYEMFLVLVDGCVQEI